jgi:hypothetical protein
LRRAILATMPPKGEETASAALQAMQKIKRSDLHRFSSRAAQEHAGIVCDLLSHVIELRPPRVAELQKEGFFEAGRGAPGAVLHSQRGRPAGARRRWCALQAGRPPRRSGENKRPPWNR